MFLLIKDIITSQNLEDYKYGINGEVAPLGDYEGGAPQYNTPMSLNLLEIFGAIKNSLKLLI